MYLLSLILGIFIARLFWRQLVTSAAILAVCVACYLLLRAAPAIGVAPAWLRSVYGGTMIGIVAGVLLAYKIIINWHVERDFDRDVERARGTADKRKV